MSSIFIVIKPSEAHMPTNSGWVLAMVPLVEKGFVHAFQITKQRPVMASAVFRSNSSSSLVSFRPVVSDCVLRGDRYFEFEELACFFRHSSSDITDIVFYSFLTFDLNLVVNPGYDLGV